MINQNEIILVYDCTRADLKKKTNQLKERTSGVRLKQRTDKETILNSSLENGKALENFAT